MGGRRCLEGAARGEAGGGAVMMWRRATCRVGRVLGVAWGSRRAGMWAVCSAVWRGVAWKGLLGGVEGWRVVGRCAG